MTSSTSASLAAALALGGRTPLIPATPIPAGCPWHDLSQYGLPNVNWCEEQVCAWINEPANAWSNVAYFLVALWIYWTIRQTKRFQSRPLRSFAPVMALMGAFSFLYHSSNVYVTQMLDFVGMYLFCFLLLCINFVRLRWLPVNRFTAVFAACVLGLSVVTAIVARFGVPIQSFISVLTLGIIITEVMLRRRAEKPYSMKGFFVSLGLLIAGATCSALDATRVWCDPTSHVLHGHAVWHVLSALSLAASFVHFRQFDAELS